MRTLLEELVENGDRITIQLLSFHPNPRVRMAASTAANMISGIEWDFTEFSEESVRTRNERRSPLP